MSRVIIKPNFTAGNVNLTPPEEFAKKFTPEYINELKEQAMSRQKEVTFDNAKTLEEKCIAIWSLAQGVSVLENRFTKDNSAPLVFAKQLRQLDLVEHCKELDEQGFTVIPPEKLGCTKEFMEELRDTVLRIAQERSGVKPDYHNGETHTGMNSPAGQHLFYLLFEDPIFEEALMNPVVRSLMKYLLGPGNVLSSSTSFVKGPGKVPLPLHSDSFINQTQKLPTNANCAYCLSNYEGREGGSICFVPGSHKFGNRPLNDQVDPIKMGAIPVIAPFGSLICWNGNTWHGAYNKITPGLRVNLTLFHCSPSIVTQERYRETVTDEMLERNGKEFAIVMGQYNHWGFQEEGPSYAPGEAATLDRIRGLPGQRNATNVAANGSKISELFSKSAGMELPHKIGEKASGNNWRGEYEKFVGKK